MNLQANIINRIFSENDIIKLKKAIVKDDIIINSILQILYTRWFDTQPKEKDLDKINYEFKRTFKDGRNYEINWLINFLEGKKENANTKKITTV